jgi:hypothetical protein
LPARHQLKIGPAFQMAVLVWTPARPLLVHDAGEPLLCA